jgi:hypothetical protein
LKNISNPVPAGHLQRRGWYRSMFDLKNDKRNFSEVSWFSVPGSRFPVGVVTFHDIGCPLFMNFSYPVNNLGLSLKSYNVISFLFSGFIVAIAFSNSTGVI